MSLKPFRVYFVRHGQSEANVIHVFSNTGVKHPLTVAGIEQAKALANRLSPEKISAVFSSPLLRATQTAEIKASYIV
jgi:broad specificity phosphatase PhoE